MHPVLPALAAALPDDDLRRHMAERRYAHAAGTGFDPDTVLTLAELEQGFARGAILASNVRVFGAYDPLDLEKMGAVRNERVRPLLLRRLAQQGGTVVVNNLQNLTPALWDLACGIEARLGVPATLAAVASFGPSGIKLHYDHGDLLILQLAGGKRWSFYGDPVDGSAPRFCDHTGDLPAEVTAEVDMRPGDVMFVPSGLFHQCVPDGYSLHVGMILRHATAADFTSHLAQELNRVARNEPFNAFLGDDAIRAQEADLKARLIARIEATDLGQWLAGRYANYARVHGIDLAAHSAASDDAIVALNLSLAPYRARDGRLRAAGNEVRATPAIDAVVERLQAGPCAVGSLKNMLAPHHDAAAVSAALDALLVAGFVRIPDESQDHPAMA